MRVLTPPGLGDLDLECDVVVVGSGTGGAVVAAQCAEAGQDVVVLEEGKHHSPEEYGKNRPSETLRKIYRDGGTGFAWGIGNSPLINVTMGKAIGGSSLLTGGVCFRVPPKVLDEWRVDRRLTEMTEAHLEPYFEEVERDCHVAEVPVHMRSRATELFGIGAEKLGYSIRSNHRNTDGCNGCGRCNFGCPHGAKMSVDLTYLPRAVKAGARIYSSCLVDRIRHHDGRATGVSGTIRGGEGQLRVRARRVVLSAGSYHSPLVLKRSGVGARSRQVGRNMTLHPGFRMMALFDEDVRGWRGALQSAHSEAFDEERITLMSVFTPPGVLAAAMPGVGPELARNASTIPNIAMFGGLVHDEGGGRVRRGFGREPFVTYTMSGADRAAARRVIRLMAETYFAAGARKVYLPILSGSAVDADGLKAIDLDRIPMRRLECSSQHPLGTCRMGSEARDSVVDPNGEAWDLRDLWVADGSILPTSLGVNPQVPIMSMALRTARRMLDRPLQDRGTR